MSPLEGCTSWEARANLRVAGEKMLKSILRKGLPGINLFSM